MRSENPILAILGIIIKIVLTVVVIGAIYKGAIYFHEFGYRIFDEPAVSPNGLGRTVTVNITEDMSARQIGKLLEAKGLIRDANLFFFQYNASEYKEDVKPGTFELSSSMTVEEMMQVMATPPEEMEQITGGIDTMQELGENGGLSEEEILDDPENGYQDEYYEGIDGEGEVLP